MTGAFNPIRTAFTTNSIINAKALEAYAGNRLYVIFIIARSGSTWLTECAKASGCLGVPHEWFNEDFLHSDETNLGCRPPKLVGTSDINLYLRNCLQQSRSPNGVAGIEISNNQTKWLCELIDEPKRLLSNVTPFYLRRRDMVAQAISLYRSAESGYFHSFQRSELRAKYDEIDYDADKIKKWTGHLLEDETTMEYLFRRSYTYPLRFTYEEMVQNMGLTLRWMHKNLTGSTDELNFEPIAGSVSPLKDRISRQWTEKFRDENADFVADIEAQRAPFDTHPGLVENVDAL